MKQFSFKLESVLAYRKLLEEGEEQKLTKIRSEVREVEELRDKLQMEITDNSRLLEQSTQGASTEGAIDMEQVRRLSGYLGKLRDDVVGASDRLSKLGRDLRVQLEKLMKARRGREVVEKLKEKGLSLHERELDALERKLHDELSVTQFGRLDKQELPAPESDS